MEKPKKKRKLLKKLKNKYRLIIYNDKTFEEVFVLRLSRLNVFTGLGILVTMLVLGTTILIAYTPLREWIPGYPNAEMTNQIRMNDLRVDSLEYELLMRDKFILNMKRIIAGEELAAVFDSTAKDSVEHYSNLMLSPSKEDSALRQSVDEEDRFALSLGEEEKKKESFELLHFFSPVKGMVVAHFDRKEKHLATDIVCKPNEMVMATLNGTVLFAGWTLETGYVIQIQHKADLVSVYKHLSQVHVSQGDIVQSGDAIGVVGNTGELTSGPHLHFELWHKGAAINPEEYIVF